MHNMAKEIVHETILLHSIPDIALADARAFASLARGPLRYLKRERRETRKITSIVKVVNAEMRQN